MKPAVKASGKSAGPIVFVVDDDVSVREGLSSLIRSVDLNVKTFSSAREFLAHSRPDVPACLVLDVRLPGLSGLDLQRELVTAKNGIPIIFITGHGDVPMAVQAMKEGAFEFVQKPFRDQDLLDRINHALEQDKESRSSLARRADVQHRIESLTPREKQVMALVVDGAANKVIAIDLGLSERTVEIHRAKVMEKMGARSVAHLVKLQMNLSNEG